MKSEENVDEKKARRLQEIAETFAATGEMLTCLRCGFMDSTGLLFPRYSAHDFFVPRTTHNGSK